MEFAYLIALCVSLFCLSLIDRRYKLAFYADQKRTAVTLLASIALFLVWDLSGIVLGIFRRGDSPFDLPFELLPELPLEELFFLTLLCYVSLLGYRFFEQRKPA